MAKTFVEQVEQHIKEMEVMRCPLFGFNPCWKELCMWYDKEKQSCILFLVFKELINKEK